MLMKHCLVFLFVYSLAIDYKSDLLSVVSHKHKSPSKSIHVVINENPVLAF